jgi:hypothetical protein
MINYFFYISGDNTADEDEYEESEESREELLEVSVSIQDVKEGKYRLIYAHPEAFLTSATGKSMLRSAIFQKNVCCIAIDEFT